MKIDESLFQDISTCGDMAIKDLSPKDANSALVPAHATAATYLRPENSSSTAVSQDGSGNLTAHSLELI